MREGKVGQTSSSFLPARAPRRASNSRQHARGEGQEGSVAMRLGVKARGKDDLMEKIGPLIESVTTSREMVPSDLTQDYGSVVFPDPLTVTEVRSEDHDATTSCLQTARSI